MSRTHGLRSSTTKAPHARLLSQTAPAGEVDGPCKSPSINLKVGDTPIRTKITDPVHDEFEGDVFDRQRTMMHWPQEVAFILGTGGLGTGVAMGLARLGVKKMFLLDFDTVDASNLNRQILFGWKDIGKRKVEAARSALTDFHCVRTEVVAVHLDAVKGWSKVVDIARECTVVFNCIDYGAGFDYAVNSLCLHLEIPLILGVMYIGTTNCILGSSYATTMLVNFFSGKPGAACWRCVNTVNESFRDNVNSEEELREWVRQNGENPGCLSLPELSAFHKQAMRMSHPALPAIYEKALVELVEDPSKGLELSLYPAFIRLVQEGVEALMLPGLIVGYDSIGFIPRDLHYPTRTVGSWVCVCTGSALMMVNAWVQGSLLAHAHDAPYPNFCHFSLGTWHAFSDRDQGATGASDPECPVCPRRRDFDGSHT